MASYKGVADRRNFLINSATFLAGTLFGLHPFAKVFASGYPKASSSPLPCIALIIDDIGYNCCRARMFLELDAPITYAILPGVRYTQPLAHEIHEKGHEIMLHQPMEPNNADIHPGPGALFVDDEAGRIASTMEKNISEVPFAIGVNNHMGSRFTSFQNKMHQALTVLKAKNLFFVDSLTSSRSTGYETAKNLRVDAAFRNFFLDHQPEESAILAQLVRLKQHAITYGQGIGIGHPYPETARAIGRFINGCIGPDISLVNVSRLVGS